MKQNQGASLRNFKVGEVAFRAGPYEQGHRALRIAKFHIVDDQTRLRRPMDEQPRLCPVIHPKLPSFLSVVRNSPRADITAERVLRIRLVASIR